MAYSGVSPPMASAALYTRVLSSIRRTNSLIRFVPGLGSGLPLCFHPSSFAALLADNQFTTGTHDLLRSVYLLLGGNPPAAALGLNVASEGERRQARGISAPQRWLVASPREGRVYCELTLSSARLPTPIKGALRVQRSPLGHGTRGDTVGASRLLHRAHTSRDACARNSCLCHLSDSTVVLFSHPGLLPGSRSGLELKSLGCGL